MTLQQTPRLVHNLCDEALQIVLLFEYILGQIQQNLIAAILLHRGFKELRILDADSAKGQIPAKYLNVLLAECSRTVRFVDNLRHANHVALIIANGHGQQCVRLVARPLVNLRTEPLVRVRLIDVDDLLCFGHDSCDADPERDNNLIRICAANGLVQSYKG